jgi:hypothetical protein
LAAMIYGKEMQEALKFKVSLREISHIPLFFIILIIGTP